MEFNFYLILKYMILEHLIILTIFIFEIDKYLAIEKLVLRNIKKISLYLQNNI